MTIKTLSIDVQGLGRFRTVIVDAPQLVGVLRFAIQVDLHPRTDVTEQAALKDAVMKAIAEAVNHPAFQL